MGAEFHGWLDEHAEGLRKPLYLQGQNGLAVELDGPALRVRQPERAAVFYGSLVFQGAVKYNTIN